MSENLIRAGYYYRTGQRDYIRLDGKNGRFHIIPSPSRGKIARIHYDIFLPGRHWAPPLPETCKAEWERIKIVIDKP